MTAKKQQGGIRDHATVRAATQDTCAHFPSPSRLPSLPPLHPLSLPSLLFISSLSPPLLYSPLFLLPSFPPSFCISLLLSPSFQDKLHVGMLHAGDSKRVKGLLGHICLALCLGMRVAGKYPTLKIWLPAFFTWQMVPCPSLVCDESTLNISFRNLFFEE